MVIIKKILVIIGIIILGVLLVIPRSYFVSDGKTKNENIKAEKLTNGPEYADALTRDIIEVQGISGDMGNTIEYTLKDLITENEAIEVIDTNITNLNDVKTNLLNLKNHYPDENKVIEEWIGNIENIQKLSKEAMPYVQSFNEGELIRIQGQVTTYFNVNLTTVGNFKVNKNEYEKALANATYEYNGSKMYIS